MLSLSACATRACGHPSAGHALALLVFGHWQNIERLEYLLGILLAAYREFEDRVGLLGEGRGAKTAAIERFVRDRLSDEFTIADVREAALGASDSLIGKVLSRLRDEDVIEPLGTGRSARWRRR